MSKIRELKNKISLGIGSLRIQDYRTFDFSLLFCIILLLLIGIVMVYSSSEFTSLSNSGTTATWLKKQIAFAAMSLIGMLFVQLFNYRLLNKPYFGVGAAIIGFALMGIVHIAGKSANGSTRWLNLGPISIQPSEVCKLLVIVYMAYIISAYSYKMSWNPKWKKTFGWSLVLIVPALPSVVLIMMENLSSALVICAIIGVMVFTVSDASKSLLAAAGIILTGMALYLKFTSSYRGGRITAWLHPESDLQGTGQQVMQSLYAVGSGGLFGKGLGNGMVKLGHLSEAFNDMIFSVICEELGLIGGLAVIAIFMTVIWRIIRIAFRAPDMFGTLLCLGVATQIIIQTLLHIGVCVNALPNTGMTLPFISYGGSSMIIMGAEIGLVLAVSKQIGKGNE